VRTSEISSMGQPVTELVPVLVMRCPVPELAICAFGTNIEYKIMDVGEVKDTERKKRDQVSKSRWKSFV
jgi:hypothetical protein